MVAGARIRLVGGSRVLRAEYTRRACSAALRFLVIRRVVEEARELSRFPRARDPAGDSNLGLDDPRLPSSLRGELPENYGRCNFIRSVSGRGAA